MIRFANSDESSEIKSLIYDLMEYEDLSDRFCASETNIKDLISSKNVIVSENENKITGYSIFYEAIAGCSAKRYTFVENLYVSPEYRGLGIASGLMAFIEAQSKEKGHYKIELRCLGWNSASEFYKSLGFNCESRSEWNFFKKSLCDNYK